VNRCHAAHATGPAARAFETSSAPHTQAADHGSACVRSAPLVSHPAGSAGRRSHTLREPDARLKPSRYVVPIAVTPVVSGFSRTVIPVRGIRASTRRPQSDAE